MEKIAKSILVFVLFIFLLPVPVFSQTTSTTSTLPIDDKKEENGGLLLLGGNGECAGSTFQVNQSSDDCYRGKGGVDYMSLTHSEQPAGGGTSGDWCKQGGGMRFTNITIPQGSTIISAYLILRGNGAYTGVDCNSKISAEDVDDPATFVNDGSVFDTRYVNHTTAIVNWDNIGTWADNTDYDSVEIKTVIQEIIDRGGWASGNDMVIFWEDFDGRSTTSTAIRKADSYDGSSEYSPKLCIEFQSPDDILVVVGLDILVRSNFYFYGIFLFLFVIYILWKK